MAATEATAPLGEAAPATSGRRRRRIALGLVALTAGVVVLADRLSKAAALASLPEGEPRHVIGDLLIFQRVENAGAAFSFASGSTWVFSIIAVAVAVVLIGFAGRIRSIGWGVLFGLLLGGTLGNLTDRLTRPPGFGLGHVVDFIRIPVLEAIFNLADVAIVSSMGLFLILTLLGVGLDGQRHRAAPRGSTTGDRPPDDA